ncbi:MAG: hypothetical protein J1F05_02970 [Muribaculaceae bacterium]|nr:hypothetical protein [Muribaculaceae bacterium]
MRYLITYSTDLIRQEHADEWRVDAVLMSDSLKNDLSQLPKDEGDIVFFIPTILDIYNSLSYQGANLALRILMYYLREGNFKVDIVLMGNENETNFLLNYDYPNILKIPGIYYVRFNKHIVANFTLSSRTKINPKEYKNYLDLIGLKMPSSFNSTHSLTNEWCLYKWNSFMGFEGGTSSLNGLLYFEYLITIEKLNKNNDKKLTEGLKEKITNLPEGTRILIIDDNEGWHRFFYNFFREAHSVAVRYIGKDFYKLQYEDIEKSIRDEVDKFNPQIIILDFRLMEDKDTDMGRDMKNVSGYRILSKVLKGNYRDPQSSFGRQVLIFTATSRIENILMLKAGNADGFILKEKPENYNGKEITKDVISHMVTDIQKGLERANFLIPLNDKLENLINLVVPATDLAVYIISVSQAIRQLTQNNKLDIDILKLLYLNIFNIFEELKRDSNFVDYTNQFTLVVKGRNILTISGKSKCAMYSKSDDDWNYKRGYTPSSRHEKFCKDQSLNFAICALVLFRLGYEEVDDTDWNIIRLIRNTIAHGNSVKLNEKGLTLSVELLQDYIIKMLNLLILLIDPRNINEITPQLSN